MSEGGGTLIPAINFRRIAMLALVLPLAACEETAPRPQPQSQNQVFITGGQIALNGDVSSLIKNQPKGTASASTTVLLPQEGDPSLDPSDPCATNLQTLTGQLLFFYSVIGTLPPSLDKLPKMDGETASLVCPKSGKPYVYFPEGLRAPADLMAFDRKTGSAREGNMLILVDSEPAHPFSQRLLVDGKEKVEKQMVRLGIVMEPPAAGKSVKMYVVPVQQALLDAYRRAN
jgi:hypothetical protein